MLYHIYSLFKILMSNTQFFFYKRFLVKFYKYSCSGLGLQVFILHYSHQCQILSNNWVCMHNIYLLQAVLFNVTLQCNIQSYHVLLVVPYTNWKADDVEKDFVQTFLARTLTWQRCCGSFHRLPQNGENNSPNQLRIENSLSRCNVQLFSGK